MSNLSKETTERITRISREYAGESKAKTEERIAYQAGALHEAERAQPVIDLLTEISESDCDYESTNFAKALHSPECRACRATAALTKYKEVSNG